MTHIKAIDADVPNSLLDAFVLHDGVLHWAATKPAWVRVAHEHWGQPAGGLPVLGYGRIVNFRGHRLLSSDVAYALCHGHEWPWQHGAALPAGLSGQDNPTYWQQIARQRWCLDDQGALVWAQTRGDTSIEGQTVKGQILSGPRGAVVSTSGMGFLKTDIMKLLNEEKMK